MKHDIELLKKPIDGYKLEPDSSFFETFDHDDNNTRLSLDGEWKFIYADKFDEDILESDFNIENLDKINVPSHMELQGYGTPRYVNMQYPWDGLENLKPGEVPSNNKVGIYIKDIEISLQNLDYFLEFEGFESALYLYVNGKFVGFSTKNYTTSTFKINEYLKDGTNRIIVAVYKYSFSSWFLDQDMWRFSGIFRSVNLNIVDKTHIVDIINKSTLDDDYRNGLLDLTIKCSRTAENLKIIAKIYEDDELILTKKSDVSNGEVHLEDTIKLIKSWSNETPNLYKVEIDLKDGNYSLEKTTLNIGFRRVEIKDGIILLNGKRLVIKGVNRHEFDPILGRAISKEIIDKDLNIIKRNNINAIRTSHYPNQNYFYSRCDELGILVLDEACIETHGIWGHKDFNDEDIEFEVLPGSNSLYKAYTLSRGLSMYHRDKLHPSIIGWSLGNESYGGSNLEALSKELKDLDNNRFIHYEGVSKTPKYEHISDVYSRMYFAPSQIEKFISKNIDKPFILCEYAHAMGNSLGNLDEYIDLIDKYPTFQGGFIWDYLDQGLFDKESGNYYYGGDFKEDFPNDDNFNANGILMVDRLDNSKLNTVRYNYQPLKFNISKSSIDITNNYMFIDTSKIRFKYEILEDETSIFNDEFIILIHPGETKSYNIKVPKLNKSSRGIIKIKAYDENENLIAFDQTFIKGEIDKLFDKFTPTLEGGLEVFEDYNHIGVIKDDFKVVFNAIYVNMGSLEAIIYKNKYYLNKPITPTLFRPNTDNDFMVYKYSNGIYLNASMYPIYNPFKKPYKILSKDPNKVVIEFNYTMLVGILPSTFKVIYSVFSDKSIKVEYGYTPNMLAPKPTLIGLNIKLDKSFEEFKYIGLGPYDTYIDRYKGVEYGIFESNAHKEFIKYSRPQECANHEYTRKIIFKSRDGLIMSFRGIDKTFGFNYLPYSPLEIEKSNRIFELHEDRYNYLTISSFNKGVGGDDSWGAKVHKQYIAKNKKYKNSFIIKIEDTY